MRFIKLIIFLILVLITSCINIPEKLYKDYKYEKMVLNNYNFEFEIHLENIKHSNKISKLIEKLIYEDKSFNEYVLYTENNHIENINETDYPQIINDDGTEYIYNSYLQENYSIKYFDNSYIIIEYNTYIYYTGQAHGNYLRKYFIIDISEERILNISDIINQMPDDLLIEFIKSKYNINYFLRENIWAPDTINFNNNNIELIWNTYSITAYSYGIITIEIDDNIEKYLTDKGKKLIKLISNDK